MVNFRLMGSDRPLTLDSDAKRKVAGCAGCFLGVFGLVGLAVFAGVFVPAGIRIARASGWTETPCRIVSSGVGEHFSGRDATYSIDVTFEYEADGRRHTSNRYSFNPGTSSSGSAGKWEVVNSLRPGTKTTCYVDPADPASAVLRRGFTSGFLFAVIPLLFMVVGFGGMVAVRRQSFRLPAEPEPQPAGPARLKATGGWPGVIVLAVVALIWNGASWLLVVPELQIPSGGALAWIKGLLPLLFPAIGLVLVGKVIHAALARFNPHTTLDISRSGAAVGESFQIEWNTTGRLDRVVDFRILLEGVEVAVRSGKRSRTWKETFATIPIAGSDMGHDYRSGRGTVRVPEGTMHSLKAGENEILWLVRVQAKLKLRPDVDEEFPLEIRP